MFIEFEYISKVCAAIQENESQRLQGRAPIEEIWRAGINYISIYVITKNFEKKTS